MNTTLRVERSEGNGDHSALEGPLSLVYKKYGGNKMSETASKIASVNSPLTQSLISYEVSKRGWGPKLYGLFDDGRIEECVDGRLLSASEAFEEEMTCHMAKAFARFHSLDLPFDKKSVDPLTASKKAFLVEKPLLQEWIDSAVATEECLTSFRALLDFPLEEEYTWVSSVFAKTKHRKAFCAMDSNYLNRLVRKDETVEHRCLIIDYDISCWYDRAFDLSSHFIFRLITAENRDNFLTGSPYPSREEQRYFLARYLEEASKVFQDFDPHGMDNVDHLQLETDIYALIVLLWQLYVSCHYHKIYQIDPNIYFIINCFIDLYRKLKDEFCVNHPHLVASIQ